MDSDIYEHDDQEQAELFDEDNLVGDDAPGSTEFKTFEELPELFDDTARLGDAEDSEALDEADFSEDAASDEDLEDLGEAIEADAYGETDEDEIPDLDARDGVTTGPPTDVEIEYQADVQDRRGAQSSAAHFETRGQLDDATLKQLGYADEEPPRKS